MDHININGPQYNNSEDVCLVTFQFKGYLLVVFAVLVTAPPVRMVNDVVCIISSIIKKLFAAEQG